MKTRTLIFSLLLILSSLSGCKKAPEDTAAPTPDMPREVQPVPTNDTNNAKPETIPQIEPGDQAVTPQIPAAQDQNEVSPDSANTSFEKFTLSRANDLMSAEENQKHAAEILALLKSWNTLRNTHDSNELAKLYDKSIHLRGSDYTDKTILKKLTSSFEKHPDYVQTPANSADLHYILSTELIDQWAVSFSESFTQDGKTRSAEILLILNRYEDTERNSKWLIAAESDVDTDLNLIKKLNLIPVPEKAQKAFSVLLKSVSFRSILHENYAHWSQKDTIIEFEECENASMYGYREGFVDDNPNDQKYYFALYERLPDDEGDADPDDPVPHNVWNISHIARFAVDMDKGEIYDCGVMNSDPEKLAEKFNPDKT